MAGDLSSMRDAAGDDWAYYNGNPAGTHFSALNDINAANVTRLRVAWTYDTDDELLHSQEADDPQNSTMESNPLIVGGRMFLVSPKGRLICLDGATGHELWIFKFAKDASAHVLHWLRGVSYWTDGKERRILFGFRRNLYAVDADTGRGIRSFGTDGHVEVSTDTALSTSPGVVYQDLIIMGGDGSVVRAFDVRTGALRWVFHTVPRPGEFGYDTWSPDAYKRGRGVNVWAGMTLDERLGLLFVPCGEASDSLDGVDRAGDDLYSDSLVAVDARTGRRVWYFQTVRHDLWDRDLPAAPTLISIIHQGKRVDAVAQITKSGYVFVLDRLSGKSLFPLVEQPTFPSGIPGEKVAKTQIVPRWPLPFARQRVTPDILTRRTPEAAAAVATQFKALHHAGPWDPPSVQGTIVFPGMDGGAEWGGAAFDPQTGLLYVNSNEIPWIAKLKKYSPGHAARGSTLYQENCSSCHGVDRTGKGEFPSLAGVGARLSAEGLANRIQHGGSQMPAFPFLEQGQVLALTTYLLTGVDQEVESASDKSSPSSAGDTYVFDGIPKFRDPDGYPAISPPWGTLNAINLNTGRYAWKIPFGEYPALVAQGLKNTGSENYGGSIVTAGGLLFIGATSFDKKFHAYDKRTGQLLWETVLPAAGVATPATYRVNGRQFVVITAGGGRPEGSKPGSKVVAFAIPD